MPEKTTILVVDDRSVDRRLLKKMLESRGYDLQEATDGLEGLEMAELRKPDLIIADTMMPVMDGFQFLRNAKKDKRTKDIPFILYSAVYTGYEDEKLALSLGANAFIQKPIETEKFLEKVEAVIQGVKARKETTTKELIEEEEEYLRRYSQVVAARLEETVGELEATNECLQLQITEELRVEEALHKERDRAQHYLDVAGVALIIIGVDRRVSLVNKKGCEILGYEKEDEIIDKDWFDNFVPERLRDEVTGVFESLMAGEIEPVEYYENPVLTKDGEERIVAWHNAVLRDEHGKIHATLGSGEDVTERRRAEEALRASEEKYRVLFETAKDAIFLSDETGKFIDVNQAACKTLGYSKEELLKLSNREIDAGPAGYEAFLQVRNGLAKEAIFEVNQRRKDGTLLPVEITGKFFESDGKQTSLAIARDITERKAAEDALWESEEKYRTVFENTGTATAIIEEDTTISMTNTEFDKLGGYSKEEVEGKKSWTEFVVEEDLERMKKYHVERRKKGGKAPTEYEFRFVDKQGNIKDIFLKIGVLPGAKRSVASSMDITSRKRAEEALRIERDNLINILESMDDGVYIVDQQYDIQYVNPVLKKDFGSVEGRKCYKYFQDRDEVCPWCQNQDVFAGKTVRWEWYSFKNQRTYDLIDTPLKNPDGSISKLEIFRDITERKRMEEALERSEACLNVTGQMAKVGGWELDAETLDVRWTDETYRIHEVPVDYKPPLDEAINFYHPEDRPKLEHAIRRALEHGEPYDMEIRFITARGKHLWVHTICKPHIVDGKTVKLTGTFQDITERKAAEEALKEAERKYHTLVDNIPAVTYVAAIDEASTTLYVSSQIETVLGVSPDTYKDDPDFWRKHLHPDDHERVLAEVTRSHNTNEPFISEYRMFSSDGSQVWLHDEARIVKDDKENPLYLQGVMTDITERKAAEDALLKSEKQLRETKDYLDNIIESSADAVVVVDMDGTVRSWNKAAEDYMGYTADEVIGTSNRKFFADPGEPDRIMEMVLRDGELKNYRTTALNKDKKPVQISMSAALLKDSDGVPIGIVRISRDVTKEVELEERIEEERDNMNLIFDSMVDGVYSVSKDYEIEFMNKVLIDEFGGRVGSICYKAFHDREEPCPLCKNPEVMKGETVQWEWNSRKRNKTYDLIETPLKNIDGTISKLTMFRDITERKRAEEELEKKIEELRRFNEMTVDRELKMVELKKEINTILHELGKEPRYKIPEEINTGTSE